MGNEMGNERGMVGSHAPHLSSLMWLGVVSFSCPPPFQCTTLSMRACLLLAVSLPIGIKPGYVASGWGMYCRAAHGQVDGLSV